MGTSGATGMNDSPGWLPPFFHVNPWTNETFDQLYAIFRRDFKDSRPRYEGKYVWFFPEMERGKEVIFWHMTSRDDKATGERLPDFRRSERLPWARPMIDNSRQPEVLAWDYEEGDRTVKTYIWLKDHDFLVLLKKYKDGRRRLLTAYYIDQPHYRRKLEKKYKRRVN
jgi:hypothetical protein